MVSLKGEIIGLSPRKASLRKNRNYAEESLEEKTQDKFFTNGKSNLIKCVNLANDKDNSKRKRRESHDTSGSDKDDSRRQLVVPKLPHSPTINVPVMDLKKYKFETEKERMFRVSDWPSELNIFNESDKLIFFVDLPIVGP